MKPCNMPSHIRFTVQTNAQTAVGLSRIQRGYGPGLCRPLPVDFKLPSSSPSPAASASAVQQVLASEVEELEPVSTFSGKCTGLAKQIGTGAFGTLTSQKPKSRSSRQPLNPERMSGIAGIRDMSNKSLHRAMRFMLQFLPSESAARCLRLSPARALMDSANPAASSIGTGQASSVLGRCEGRTDGSSPKVEAKSGIVNRKFRRA